MVDQTEVEILNGSRAWAETQAAFVGAIDAARTRYSVDCGWYDTRVDENEGAFCMVRTGSDLEELIGDFVRVSYADIKVYLYCVGASANVSADLALARTAFMRLQPLNVTKIRVIAQAMQ